MPRTTRIAALAAASAISLAFAMPDAMAQQGGTQQRGTAGQDRQDSGQQQQRSGQTDPGTGTMAPRTGGSAAGSAAGRSDPRAARTMVRPEHRDLFESADLNDDGRVTRQEAAAAAQGWIDRHDSDANGRLSMSEFRAASEGSSTSVATQSSAPRAPGESANDHDPSQAAEAFRWVDSDSNGEVSQGELTAVFERMLSEGDSNDDDALSRSELAELRDRWGQGQSGQRSGSGDARQPRSSDAQGTDGSVPPAQQPQTQSRPNTPSPGLTTGRGSEPSGSLGSQSR